VMLIFQRTPSFQRGQGQRWEMWAWRGAIKGDMPLHCPGEAIKGVGEAKTDAGRVWSIRILRMLLRFFHMKCVYVTEWGHPLIWSCLETSDLG
jgi:hypothetical protein